MDTQSQSYNDSGFESSATEFDCNEKWWEEEPEIAKICDNFEKNCPNEIEIDSCK